MTSPPFGLRHWPTKWQDSSEARNTRMPVMSSTVPRHPIGWRAMKSFLSSARTSSRLVAGPESVPCSVRQERHVLLAVQARKTVHRTAITLHQGRSFRGALHKPRQLRARVARGVHQVAAHQPFVGTPEPAVAKAPQRRRDVRVARPIVARRPEMNRRAPVQKRLQLRQRLQLRIVHVDHHVRNDRRPTQAASGSYLVGNTPPRSGSYHVG